MKKIVVFFSIFLIFLSIAKAFPCEQMTVINDFGEKSPTQCSEVIKCSATPHHSLCNAYTEVLFDTSSLEHAIAFHPHFIGHLFFPHINIEEKDMTDFHDRPPIFFS